MLKMRHICLSKLCMLKISRKKQVVDRCFLPKEMFLDHYEVLLTFFSKSDTLPETNIFAPENRPFQNIPKGRVIFQPSIFRCKPFVSGRVVGSFNPFWRNNPIQKTICPSNWILSHPILDHFFDQQLDHGT